MKICVLTHTFPRNNQDVPAAFMKEFCDSLVLSGNQVIVLTPYDDTFHRVGDKFKIVTYKYILPKRFHLLGYSRSMEADVVLKKMNFLLLPLMLFWGFIRLLFLVQREKIDLISVHWILPNGLMALVVSKITGVPYVVTLPGTDAYLAYKNKMFGWVAKIIAVNSSALFSNSSWHLDRILKLGVKVPISKVITYPVDTDIFKPDIFGTSDLRKKYKISKDNIILLAVGRLAYKKGFNYLIQAMKDVVKKYPKTTLIIGGNGDLLHEWEQLKDKLGLGKSVIFIGTVKRDEIVKYYNLADIMVTPSIIDQEGNIDGRPLVILESMACGKPQVVTDLPGISDSLIDGENAILVPEKSSSALCEAINKLISSKSLREKMGKANRKLAVDKLSINKIGKQYNDYFKEAVNTS